MLLYNKTKIIEKELNNLSREIRSMKMEKVVIIAAKRTPIGTFDSIFKEISAVDLGVIVLKEILHETNLSPSLIDEIIIGNVLGAGLGQNVARQVAIKSGVPFETPAFTVNKVCGSGMKAISLAAQQIKLGEAEIMVAGGTENMSQVPYLLQDARWGARMNDKSLVDMMVYDGLTDVFNNYHMGITAENLAEKYQISRQEQDQYATASQNKAERAILTHRFQDEIVKISLPQRKGDPLIISTDEFPRPGVTMESLAKLRPAFKADGTVTAANASGINNGAALLLLMSERKALEFGIKPLAYFLDSTVAGVDPKIMGYGPVPAIKKILARNNRKITDIGLAELNEAFAAQALAVYKGIENEIGSFDQELINVNGGAISLGHPIGASGARIMVTLVHEMNKRNTKLGLAALCIGGGMGIASLLER